MNRRPSSTSIRRPRGLHVLLIAIAAGALLGAGCTAPSPDTRSEIDSPNLPASTGWPYAALGDSYSAGEGTHAYLPGTDVPGTNMCHRSTLAYPELLSTRQDLSPVAFVACSGGTTADLFDPNNNQNKTADGTIEPAQLCQTIRSAEIEPCGTARPAALGPDTRVVTLTIGGNDIGFARVAEACIFGQAGRYRIGLPGRGCRDDPAVIERTLRRIAALGGLGHDTSPYGTTIHPLADVLTAIHTVAPQAQVFVAGYPRIFEPATGAACQVGTATAGTRTVPVQITAADAKAFDNAVQTLDATIAATAATDGPWATYVNPTRMFTGHGLCTDTPWINPLHSVVTYDTTGRSIAVTSDPGSVHPTPRGQHDGYTAAYLQAGIPTG